jgi:hypothetical protein
MVGWNLAATPVYELYLLSTKSAEVPCEVRPVLLDDLLHVSFEISGA